MIRTSAILALACASFSTAQSLSINITGEGQNGFGPYTATIDLDTTNWPGSCPATGVLQFTAVPPATISGTASLIDGCSFEVFGDILGDIPGVGPYEWVIQAMFSVEDNTAAEISGNGVTRVIGNNPFDGATFDLGFNSDWTSDGTLTPLPDDGVLACATWPVISGGNGRTYEIHRLPVNSNWEAARVAAIALGGKLVAFETRAERDFVFSSLSSRILDGVVTATSLVQDFGQIDYSEPGGGWIWWEGGPVRWAAWNAGEPNNSNAGSSEDFSEFQFGGGFNDIIDGSYSQMLVELPADDDTPIAEDEVVLGSTRFVRYRTRGGMSWTELQDFALAEGGQLACFETEAELDAATPLGDNLPDGALLAIGLVQAPGSIEPAGGWGWINGAALTYDRWAAAEPNDSPLGEDVVQMLSGGFWNDIRDQSNATHAILEFSDAPPPPPVCPEDLDDSGSVDFGDILAVLSSWGTSEGDVDGNGTTDFGDILAVLSEWGVCSEG